MDRVEKALSIHKSGSSCSQAVFTSFAADLGLEEGIAHRLSGGLGGGMGRLGYSCGAITGGVLALSMIYGSESGADQDAKMKTYEEVSKLFAAMETAHGSSQCRVLLEGADLWKAEDREAMKAKGLGDKVCNTLIAEVVRYVEAHMPEGKHNG
ncbi:MAG: C-GCAxxG-C-C family protein [Spirochaetia bacterium]|jgi:C_GCAxxG_C_C family probable redox protein|nr:C-GCAxxG-C-C family protein [Spirochaetia bacterium]